MYELRPMEPVVLALQQIEEIVGRVREVVGPAPR